MVHIHNLEGIAVQPSSIAGNTQEAGEIIWQLGSRLDNLGRSIDAVSSRMDTILLRAAQTSKDPPPTTCEKIGAYIIRFLRYLGLAK